MASFPVNVEWSMSKVAVPPSLPRKSAPPALPAAPASLPEKVESLIVSVPLDVYSTAPAAWPQSLSENVVPVIVTSPAGDQLSPAALFAPEQLLCEITSSVRASESPVQPPRMAPPPYPCA